MLFHTFGSQEERRKSGGSDFAELQYCRLPRYTELREIVAVDAAEHWRLDSLYINGADFDVFFSMYGSILTDGLYNNMNRGPMDLFGKNYYTQKHTEKIIERIAERRPADYQVFLHWLEAGRGFNGFYLMGE